MPPRLSTFPPIPASTTPVAGGRARPWPALLLGLLTVSTASAAAAGFQSPADIRQAAVAAVQAAAGAGAEAEAESPDPRLRLPRCDQPLTAALTTPGLRAGRMTAEVRCDGTRPWRLYLPVRLLATRPVVVATRALARDTVLAPADVRLAPADPRSTVGGALNDPALAVGQRLRRPAEAGQVLTTGLLDAPVLVRRGQQVTLEAAAGSLAVRMSGTARGDGALGQIIEVENASSGRLVQAVVRSAKSVEVLLR